MFQVIDKSFGFDTAVEEAQRAINAAHVEAVSAENGIGLVKLMGRHSGKFYEGPICYASNIWYCQLHVSTNSCISLLISYSVSGIFEAPLLL